MRPLYLDDAIRLDVRVLGEEGHRVAGSSGLGQLEPIVREESAIEILSRLDFSDLVGGDHTTPCDLFLTKGRDEHG